MTTYRKKRAGGFVVRTIQVGFALLVVLTTIAAALWVDGGTDKNVLLNLWWRSTFAIIGAGGVLILIHDGIRAVQSFRRR